MNVTDSKGNNSREGWKTSNSKDFSEIDFEYARGKVNSKDKVAKKLIPMPFPPTHPNRDPKDHS